MSRTEKYGRVLLKMSGEALMGETGYGIDWQTVNRLAGEVQTVHESGVEVCLVIGGGNIFRGGPASGQGIERASADYMGMLATENGDCTRSNRPSMAGCCGVVPGAI